MKKKSPQNKGAEVKKAVVGQKPPKQTKKKGKKGK